MTPELITLLANVALTLSFIVALIFGIAQVKASSRDRRERLTLEALHNFQTREFSELIHFVTRHEVPCNYEGMLARPAEEQIMLIQFSQQMESLGLLVAERFIDIELVDKTLGSLVTVAWGKYKVMFFDIRVKAPDPFLRIFPVARRAN